jgi:hypothetical protein
VPMYCGTFLRPFDRVVYVNFDPESSLVLDDPSTVLRLPVSPVGFDHWPRKFSIDKHDVYWYAIWCKCAPGDSPFVIAGDT